MCQLLQSAVSSSGWSHISRSKVGSHSSSKVKTVQESVIGISSGPFLTPQRSMRAVPESALSALSSHPAWNTALMLGKRLAIVSQLVLRMYTNILLS